MKNTGNQDIRSLLLQWLLPFILLLLVFVFAFSLMTNPKGSYERQAYPLLIGFLILIDALAYLFAKRQNYKMSSLLTVAMAMIGTWGAILIDSRFGFTEFFPLIYVTVSVLVSSVLLPLLLTIGIASVQLVALTVIIFHSPVLLGYNWPSFISYVLIASVICIVANYVSSYQIKRFQQSSVRDHLTGLLNRRYFDVTLEDKVKRGGPKAYTYGVMLLDIDNFKKYNDRYSHATGDIILQRVASFLSDALGLHSVVCRYGGDEFAIIISNIDHARLSETAEMLRQEIKTMDITDFCPEEGQVSISIGLALFPHDGKTAEDLMAQADRNLLLAKELGKDRVMPG